MRIDVWADVTCPWCLLGKRRLDRALAGWRAEYREPIEVRWLPFQINPEAAVPSVRLDRSRLQPYFEAHSEETVDGYLAEGAAVPEGAEFHWNPQWSVNSFEAHRLLRLAWDLEGELGQARLLESLLRAHFVDGTDLGDPAVLRRVAERAGFSAPGAGEARWAEAGRAVEADLALGRDLGVDRVPTYVVGERRVVGAEPPKRLLALLRTGLAARVAADGADLEFVDCFRLAETLLDEGDSLEALTALGPLLAAFPQDRSVIMLAARAYLGSGQLGRAEHLLADLTERYPADDYARFLLGRAVERQGRIEDARRHIALAVGLSARPEYADRLAGLRAAERVGSDHSDRGLR